MAIVPGQGYLDPNLWVTADFTSGENILPVIIIDPDTGDPIIPGGGGGNTFNNGIGDIGGGVIGLGGNPIIQTTLVVPDIPNTHNIFFGQQPASLFDNIGFAANQNIQFNTGTLGVTDFTTSTISQNSINFGLFNFPFFQGITLQMSTLSGILLQDDIFQKGMEGATLFNVDWVNDDNYYAQVGLIKQRIGNQLIDATVLNPGAAEDLQFIQWDNGSGLFVMAPGGGGGSGIDIENDGLALGSFTTINGIGGGFVDAGGGVADYTPPAGSVPGGAPVDVTKSAAQAGVSAAYSREDHKHDIATASGVTVGSANTEGSSTSLARADHTHIVGSFVDQAGVGTTLTLGIINDGEALIRSGASIISTAIPALQDLQSVITQGSVADLTAATDLVISDSSSDSIFTIEETTGNVDINSTSSYSINGKSALRVIGTSGGFPDSVVIAGNSADSLDTGSFNSVIIGEGILPGYSAVISDSVLIGNNIGFSTAQLPGETIALGSDVFPGLQGTLNSGQIGIGFDVGRFITSANSNTLVGNRVRDLTATSSGNSVFGYDACGLATSAAARITATNTSIFGRQLAGNTSNGSRAFTNCAFFGAQGMTNDSITVSDTISIGINNNVTAATSTDNSMLFGSDIIVDGHNNVKIFAHTAYPLLINTRTDSEDSYSVWRIRKRNHTAARHLASAYVTAKLTERHKTIP